LQHPRPLPRRIASLVGLSAVLALSLAPGGEAPVPWPYGEPPSGAKLDAILTGALDLADLERFEEFLEASEKGEDREHVVVRQDDIDAGFYSKEQLFLRGDALFSHEFRQGDGFGSEPYNTLHRVHTAVRGGLDTYSCAGCHSVGGADGAGSETQNAFLFGDGDRISTAVVRNAPHALGLGMVQALAAEMTVELTLARQAAIEEAAQTGAPVALTLTSKGVAFGSLTAHPDGSVDTAKVEGVSEDLVVRPFGWKGNVARLRRFVEDAARIHFGVQSHVLALGYKDAPDLDRLGPGPDWWDPDGDGVQRELEEGTLTAGALYLAMLEVPVIIPPHDPGLRGRWSNGQALFDAIGCAGCHTRELALNYSYWSEAPDTGTGAPYKINLLLDGDAPKGSSLVKLFSDLKRHDMGPELADARESDEGIPKSVFLTRPLWGLAETPPYLHDGRAPTIPAAILAHGGEAKGARDAFAALSAAEQADVHIFLLSLTREPKVRVAQ
jgi:hypothetical protein